MKIELLPSTFEENGAASQRQHLSCLVINDRIALDAGSLAMAASETHRELVRNVVLTHAHLDHVAGLPLFIDDLFPLLTSPINVHAEKDVIKALGDHIFNWHIYPDFSQLKNEFGDVLRFVSYEFNDVFELEGLKFEVIRVNHKVPSAGFLISDAEVSIAVSGDTSETDEFWDAANRDEKLKAVFIECAFPDSLNSLAVASHHLTPSRLRQELKKLKRKCPVYVFNLKPSYREVILGELSQLSNKRVEVLQSGRGYTF